MSPMGFVARAAVLMLLFYAAYYFPYAPGSPPHAAIDAFLRVQARAAHGVIVLFDPSARLFETTIRGRFALEVVRSCSSLDAQALLAATVLAFPAPRIAKLIGLGLGALALTSLNVARIASLYFIGADAPRAFDAAHEELFPLLLIALACACFALWALWVRAPRAGALERAAHG